MLISSAYAQVAPAAPSGGFELGQFALPLLLLVVMYFVMIRPQMKRQKELRTMIDSLASGDEVATVGGLLGRVTQLDDLFLGLELATGVEVKLQRSAVVQVLPKGTLK